MVNKTKKLQDEIKRLRLSIINYPYVDNNFRRYDLNTLIRLERQDMKQEILELIKENNYGLTISDESKLKQEIEKL